MTNTNDIGTAAAGSDFDDVYEKSLDELRASRSGRLGSRTLGVLSTSIALGDGREYVRRANRALLMTNDSLSSEIVLRPCKDTIDTILLTLLPHDNYDYYNDGTAVEANCSTDVDKIDDGRDGGRYRDVDRIGRKTRETP
jgi:hypothetical protein